MEQYSLTEKKHALTVAFPAHSWVECGRGGMQKVPQPIVEVTGSGAESSGSVIEFTTVKMEQNGGGGSQTPVRAEVRLRWQGRARVARYCYAGHRHQR